MKIVKKVHLQARKTWRPPLVRTPFEGQFFENPKKLIRGKNPLGNVAINQNKCKIAERRVKNRRGASPLGPQLRHNQIGSSDLVVRYVRRNERDHKQQ